MKKIDSLNFPLEEKLTREQLDYFDKNGVIIFRNFISKETVEHFISEIDRIEKQWLDEGRDKVNGVPLKFGKDENGKTVLKCLQLFNQNGGAVANNVKIYFP